MASGTAGSMRGTSARPDCSHALAATARQCARRFSARAASSLTSDRSVVIGTRVLQPGQDFTYEVSAEEILSGGRFVREIVSGPFQPASRIEYDDPGDRH